jgi:hypothetical protein
VMALTRRYEVPIQNASVVEPPMSFTIACYTGVKSNALVEDLPQGVHLPLRT